MRIGMALYASNPFSPLPMESLRYVVRSLRDACASRHELVFLPQTYICASPDEEQAMNEEFLRSCDVIVGSASVSVPATRHRIGSRVPIVSFTLGVLSRGGFGMDNQAPYLTSNDVLLVNCTSDLALANQFFSNARVRLLPFAIDRRLFYPLDEAQRAAARERLGFRQQDRILVYSGRTTLQKNVHTLLKVFSVVQRVVPDACLVIAGPIAEHGAPEFGIAPVKLANTLGKLASGLGIPPGRLRMMGSMPVARLRELYNIADVKVNLSLHHDENFGLAQVEAMACGTPVIGTVWGGLKDTIVDGVSGYRVSTSLTPLGVKASWWEAVNRIVALLRDPAARERFRDSCVRHAAALYSQARYEATLLEILAESACGGGKPAEPLQPTAFAQELWSTCHPLGENRPPHLRGPRSYALYQEMIRPIAGVTPEAVPAGEALAPGQVLTLATPVTRDAEGRFRSNDPMYPFDIDVAQAHAEAFEAILSVVREEPALTVERLCQRLAAGVRNAADTLAEMLDRGLLLRTRPVDGWLPPEAIDRRMSEPFFRIERLDDRSVDFWMHGDGATPRTRETPMRVLLATLGSRGDVQPLVALADRLRALGVEVRLCVPPDFRDWIEGLGIPFTPIGPEQRSTRQASPGGGVPTPEQRYRKMERTLAMQFETLAAAARGCDLIVGAAALKISAPSVAEKMGIPYVFVAYSPTTLPSPHHPPPALGMLGGTPPPATDDHSAGWAENARQWNTMWGPLLNLHRAALGLEPVTDVHRHVLTARAWLAADPTLAPWPDPANPAVFQTGAWILPDERPLAPELEAFIDAGEPPVYFGFGSSRAPDELGRMMIESARALGRRAIVSRGWADLSLVDGAADCLAIGEVNHQALFARVAAVVHHGGAGTTTAAARAGAPQVVIPQQFDQDDWAQRVHHLGIGTAHAPGTPTTASLTRALEHALRPDVAVRARSIARSMRGDGARVAAERLLAMATESG